MAVTTADEFVIPVNVEGDDTGLGDMQKAAKSLGISVSKLSKVVSEFSAALEKMSLDNLEKAVGSVDKGVASLNKNLGSSQKIMKTANTSVIRLNKSLAKTGATATDFAADTTAATASVNKELEAQNARVQFAGETWNSFSQSTDKALQGVVDQAQLATNSVDIVVAGVKTLGLAFLVTGSAITKVYTPGLVGSVEKMLTVGPLLFLMGNSLRQLDNDFANVLGTASLLASFFLGSLTFAFGFVLNAVGDLAISLGVGLFKAVTKAEEKFIKFEKSMVLFKFAVKSFGKELGVEFVGSLGKWDEKLNDVVSNTKFSLEQTSKAIKLLIAEGSALGLSFEKTSEILGRSADIASFHGRKIEDVTLAILGGLTGNSTATIALGIDLKELALANLDYVKASGLAISEMTEQEKIQVRLMQVMKKSNPVVGAAAKELETFAGMSANADKKLERLTIRLGEMGFITKFAIKTWSSLLDVLLDLGDETLETVGNFADVGAAILVVSGAVIKFILIITTAFTVFKVLNTVMASNVVFQQKYARFMLTVFNVKVNAQLLAQGKIWALLSRQVGAAMASMVLSVKTSFALLHARFIAMGGALGVLRAAFISTFASMTAVLGTFATAMRAMTVAVLANPLFWKAILIAGAIAGLVVAVRQLWEELDFLKEGLADIAAAFTMSLDTGLLTWNDTMEVLKETLKAFIQIIADVIKILLGGLLGSILVLGKSIVGLRMAWALLNTTFGSDESIREARLELKALTLQNAEIDKRIRMVAGSSLKAGANIAGMFETSAIAADLATQSIEKHSGKHNAASKAAVELAKKVGVAFQTFANLSDKQVKSLDKVIDKTKDINQEIQEMGKTEVQLARIQQQRFTAEITALETSIKKRGEINAITQKQIDLAKKAAKALADAKVEELRLDALKSIREENRGMAQELAVTGLSQVDAIDKRLEFDLKALKIKEDELDAQDLLTQAVKDQIKEQRKLLGLKAKKDIEEAKKKNEDKESKTTDIISPDQLTQMSDVLGKGVGGAIGGALAAFNPAGAFMAVANMITGAIQSLIDFGPNFLDAIANIFNSLTDLPLKLMQALNGVFDSVLNFLTNFVANLGDAIAGMLDGFADFLIAFPDVLLNLVADLPGILDKLISRLPEIAKKLGMAFGRTALMLLVTLPIEFMKVLPGMISEIHKAIPDIASAFVDGVILGLKDGFNSIANALGFDDIFNIDMSGPMEELEKLGDTIARSTADMFQVVDLEAAGRGLDVSDRIRDAILSATRSGANFLQRAWDAIIFKLKEAWLHVIFKLKEAWLHIFRELSNAWEGVKKAFDVVLTIFKNILSTIGKALSDIIAEAGRHWDNTTAAFKKALGDVWAEAGRAWENGKKMFSDAWESMKDAFASVMKIFSNVLSTVSKGLGDTFAEASRWWDSTVGELGKAVQSAFDGISFKEMFKSLKAGFKKLDPSNIIKKMFDFKDKSGQGDVETLLGIKVPFANFAQGGLVPGKAKGPGDSIQNDNVLALLSPGEFIVPRSLAQDPAVIPFLKMLQKGETDTLLNLFKVPTSVADAQSQLGDGSGAVDTVTGGVEDIGATIGKAIEDTTAEAGRIPGNVGDLGVMQAFKGQIEKMTRHGLMKGIKSNFQHGGIVGGSGGIDSTPGMLTPGEFVVKKNSAQPNLASLNFLNTMGRLPTPEGGGGGDTSISVTINAKTMLSPDMIKREVIPVVEKEFRRASMRGRFILSNSGTRDNR